MNLGENSVKKIEGCGEKEAVVMFQELKERDPYDESLYSALMKYYNSHGRYRKSAGVYKEIAELLREELSVEPGAELAALYKNTLERLSKKIRMCAEHVVPEKCRAGAADYLSQKFSKRRGL